MGLTLVKPELIAAPPAATLSQIEATVSLIHMQMCFILADEKVISKKLLRELERKEERLLMGFSMFDSAKAIMLASRQNLSITEKRKMIFLRLYGNEFDHPTIKKVLAHLESLSV